MTKSIIKNKLKDKDQIKKKEKFIAKLLSDGYSLFSIYNILKSSGHIKSSLFNFYRIIRTGNYPLINEKDKLKDSEIIGNEVNKIVKMINKGYLLQDIYYVLKNDNSFKSSLFNFYKLIRTGNYPLINDAISKKIEK